MSDIIKMIFIMLTLPITVPLLILWDAYLIAKGN